MRLLIVILCLSLPAMAQDGGVPQTRPRFFKVPENARITVGFDAPVEVSPGYYLTDLSFQLLNNELKRLQDRERIRADTELAPPLKAYLIGSAIVASVFSVAGVVLGWYLWERK